MKLPPFSAWRLVSRPKHTDTANVGKCGNKILYTIPFTRWRLPKHPRAVKRMREYRRRVDAFKEHLEVLRVNQDQAITRIDELVQSQDKMNDAVKQELKELLTKTI